MLLQLVFECTHGIENNGFGAIDNIVFDYSPAERNCEVLPPEAGITSSTASSPTQPSDSFPDCNFDEDTCGWIVDAMADMKWMRTTVGNLNDMGYDGPNNDFDGYFMYVSAKDGYAGDSTTLLTPMMPTAVKGCLTFHFSIYVSMCFFVVM